MAKEAPEIREDFDLVASYLAEVFDVIKNAKKITLLTRREPYGDSIAVCTAFERFLEKMGKEVEVISGKPADEFPVQPKNWLIWEHKQTPDLIISLDTFSKDEIYYPEAFHDITLINIDHHKQNDIMADYHLIVLQVTSSCEFLYYLMKEWNYGLIDNEILEMILFGIIADSDVLRSEHVYPRTFQAIADITKKGVNFNKLRDDYLKSA